MRPTWNTSRLAWLALAVLAAPTESTAGADLPAPVITRQTSFAIPFRYAQAAQPGEPQSEVELYVSSDRGETWKVYAKAQPPQRSFNFQAAGEGEYWYSVRTRDAAGKLLPEGPAKVELCVVIDTTPPKLSLAAHWDASGELVAQIEVGDPHLKHDTLLLEYQAAGVDAHWQSVSVEPIPAGVAGPAHRGQVVWLPATGTRNLVVRAQIADTAGNVADARAQVPGRPPQGSAPPAERDTDAGQSIPPDPFALRPSAERGGGESFVAPPSGDPLAADTVAGNALPGHSSAEHPDEPFKDSVRKLPADPARVRGTTVSARPTQQEPLTPGPDWSRVVNPQEAQPSAASPWPPDDSTAEPLIDSAPPEMSRRPQFRTAADLRPAGSGATDSISFPGVPPGARPRMINSTQFALDYDVEAIGPWGIRKVELWGTRDGGETWAVLGEDADHQSPLLARVQGEGMYGFRILVQSGSGMVELPPRSGDLPEVWIGVDLTPPAGSIVRVEAGTGERTGQLMIDWQATDNLPLARPITLAYSDRPEGPWTTIAAGLRNTGRFVWQLDDRMPDEVYLRLELRDEAGNVALSDYAEAIPVHRLRPKGRIRDVRPVSEP